MAELVNAWIFEHSADQRITELDVGCGRARRAGALAELLAPTEPSLVPSVVGTAHIDQVRAIMEAFKGCHRRRQSGADQRGLAAPGGAHHQQRRTLGPLGR